MPDINNPMPEDDPFSVRKLGFGWPGEEEDHPGAGDSGHKVALEQPKLESVCHKNSSSATLLQGQGSRKVTVGQFTIMVVRCSKELKKAIMQKIFVMKLFGTNLYILFRNPNSSPKNDLEFIII